MKEIRQKSLGCCFDCETFKLKSLCAFSDHFHQNSHVPTRFTDEETDGPMGTDARVPQCALRGNGYHDALGGRGARALRFDSALRRRAGDAAPAPTRATSEARAAGLWGDALWAHAARRTG